MMKKLLAVSLAAIMVFGLVACGSSTTTTTTAAATTTKAAEAAAYDKKLADPVVVTTIGQADLNTATQVLDKAGVTYTSDANLTADKVNGGTVIMVVGGSNKGLGSAGVSADQEVERGKAILAKAGETGADVICMHLGGSSRRGSISDLMIQPMLEGCSYLIVAGDGDSDGQLTAWAASVPVSQVDDTKAVVEVIAALK